MTDPFERLMSDLTLAMGQLSTAGPFTKWEEIARLQEQAKIINKAICDGMDAKLENGK